MSCFAKIAFGGHMATYGGVALGLTESAFVLRTTNEIEPIRADLFGQSIIDGMYLGMNAAIAVTLKEWTPIALTAIWPFRLSAQAVGSTGPIGTCVNSVNYARPLVIYPVTGPALQLTPNRLEAPRAVYQPQHTTEIAFGNTQRLLAIVFQLYPTSTPASGAINSLTYFTLTNQTGSGVP